MKQKLCTICGMPMKKNGKTKAEKQRWRCKACGSSSVHKLDQDVRDLRLFLDWLFSKKSQTELSIPARTFRFRTRRFWDIWPHPNVVDEIHRVIYVDGIYLARNVVILIACSESHVLSWYLARSETTRAWVALLENIAPPEMVVSDGGNGFAQAKKYIWPETKVQRCTYHVFCQVRRYTTSKPRLLAGQELYDIAKDLLYIKTLYQAELWHERLFAWCEFWADFLEEKSCIDGKYQYTHERLRRASRSLISLVRKGTLFTYLDPNLTQEGALPATNNRIEGGVNAQIRALLRNHRGMSLTRRIKAVYWWCYMHTECPAHPKEILETMPTDKDIEDLYRQNSNQSFEDGRPSEWGNGLVWSELHLGGDWF